MFYIYDILEGQYLPFRFRTKEELAEYWMNHKSGGTERTRFYNLNVTGNDTATAYEVRPTTLVDGTEYMITTQHRYLRQYMVVDENLRSVDIRDWPKEIWAKKPKKAVRWSFGLSRGYKNNSHRIKGPAFTHSKRTAYMFDEDDVPPGTVRNKTKPRAKDLASYGDESDYDARKYTNKYGSRSWKDTTKSPYQWSKHRKWVKHNAASEKRTIWEMPETNDEPEEI